MIEELIVPGGGWKAEIRRRADGNYRVVLLRWVDDDVPGYGKVASGWSEVHTGTSITDSVELARQLARELLRQYAPVE